MATQGVNGLAVATAGAGLLFAWSGITGAHVTTSLRSVLAGQQPKAGNALPIATPGANSTSAAPAAAGDTSAHSASAATNQAIGRLLAAPYGWSSGPEWDALLSLWNRESGWDNTAQNPSSGAYGVPQALPYTKMPKSAWPPSAGGSASATAQISWGLGYIKATYQTPSGAWAHEQSAGWY